MKISLAKLLIVLVIGAVGVIVLLAVLFIGTGRAAPSGILAYVSDVPNIFPRKRVNLLDTRTNLNRVIFEANGIGRIAFSPDGQKMVMIRQLEGRSVLDMVDVATSHSEELAAGVVSDAAWSPDGGKIVYKTLFEGQIVFQIVDPTGQPIQRIDIGDQSASNLIWSPDSTQIAYTSNSDVAAVYIVQLADGQVVLLIDNQSGELTHSSFLDITWSPDGRQIALLIQSNILLFDVYTRQPQPFHPCRCSEIAWSSDGKWIAFDDQLEADNTRGLYVINVDERRVHRLLDGAVDRRYPVWLPDSFTVLPLSPVPGG